MKMFNYYDNFEMLMLRHDYLSKVKNPDPNWLKKYNSTIYTTSHAMYNKLRFRFDAVGYNVEDIFSIASCYAISYMELYSIERQPTVKQNIIQQHNIKYGRPPTQQELERKECINLISFLRQKLHNAATICGRKARNIVGGHTVKAIFAKTENSVDATEEMILSDHKKYGYRKISKREFQTIKALAKQLKSKKISDQYGFPILQIEIFKEADYLYSSFICNEYSSGIDEYYIEKEEEGELNSIISKFNNFNLNEKRTYLQKFIKENKNNSYCKREIHTAKKLLEEYKHIQSTDNNCE
jgi:hypothetical protein